MEANQHHRRTFEGLLKEVDWTLERLEWRICDTFREVSWKDTDVLEIGCGRGDFGLYMALNGARTVTAVDPAGAGGGESKTAVLKKRLSVLSPSNFSFLPIRIEDFCVDSNSFDLAFGIQAVEHIHETRLPLEKDTNAWLHYKKTFEHIQRILRPGGALILTDVSRWSFWSLLRKVAGRRLLSPFTPFVYWEIHQRPATWFRLLRDSGFARVRLTWRVPYPMRMVPIVADNVIFQYFTLASFTLSAFKR